MDKQQYYCDYGVIRNRNGVVYLHCTKINDACGYQRFCTADQCVKHRNEFINCVYRKGIETVGKNNRKSSQAVKVEEQKEIKVDKIEEVKKTEESNKKTTRRYKIILVTPNYFIIDIGGTSKRIQEKTELKAGDWYLFSE